MILFATPAAADPDPGKGNPDPPRATATPCAVIPSGTSEFASCVGVTAKLDRVPSVGATATLTVTIRASRALPGTDVTITLPEQLAWERKPAESTVSPGAGKPVTLTGVVKAVAEGFGEISVRAAAGDGNDTQTAGDSVFLTVAGAGKASRLGALTKSGNQPAVRVTPTKVFQRPAGQKLRSVAGTPSPSLACDTNVTGNWGYFDQNNSWHNEMNVNVVINDAVNGRVGGALTDSNGNFTICFDSSKGTRISASFILANDSWQVQDLSGNQYRWTTEIHTVTPGVTVNVGSRTSDPAVYRGLHAFDEANDAWQFIPKPTNTCWDQKDVACRQLKISWTPDSTLGNNYTPDTNIVHLLADAPNVAMVTAHEIGHAVMDDVYSDAFPSAPSCFPHPDIAVSSSAGCAWTEGFADWFGMAVYHDNFYHFRDGSVRNLDDQGWSDAAARGDTVEMRVTGAMLDIQDSANEPIWDRSSEGFGNLWFTFTHHVSPNFSAFWNSRIADGFNVSDTGALASVYQNTIDYGFRDPLPDNQALARPVPAPHNFSMNTTTADWSVVAVVPSVAADVDLTVYDDRAETLPLASSQGAADVVDFVAIDSNRRSFGDYYPRVNNFSGGLPYNIEVAQNRNILAPGSSQIVHMPADLVAVRDTFLTAGAPVLFSVTPSTVDQDPGLFVMGDDPGNPATFVRSRSAASASSTGNGPGTTEFLSFTPAISGWYGVVITNQHGVGDYTLTRS
ncbi:hypothetical protein ACIA5C_20225 [Actinoplanes sp. NPDC051343]|uniref:hypothetical protein n=1 Tax=Actinoplanes sp. NPDC051343 TaxID=3363906 RepID=UPI0037995609